MSSDDEVIVFESPDPIELGMAKNLLEAAGIPHVVHGGNASSLLGAQMGAGFAGLQGIAVRKIDVERANEIFDEAWGTGADDKESAGD